MKKLLKKIFPRVFLKQCFLLINSFKNRTLDHILFSTYQPEEGELKLYEQKNPFLDLEIDIETFPQNIQEGFSRWNNPHWRQDQFILEIKNKVVWIEPHTGWGITGRNKLIYFSLGFGNAPYVHKPPIIDLFFRKKNQTILPLAISLRDTGEENYFHFYNDILSKLLFLRDHSMLDQAAHIVISQRLWEKHYFQTFLNKTWLGTLKWYVQQHDEWVLTKHVIFCKPYTHTKKLLAELVDLVNPSSPVVSNNKILLTRSSGSLRFIENEDEIFFVLQKYGFQKIDTTSLTLKEQIDLFFSASDVVAIHGAGITNIIFRKGASLRLLELFHRNKYLPFHYIMLARIFGFGYAAIRGTKGSRSGDGSFYIDPAQVEAYCKSLIVV